MPSTGVADTGPDGAEVLPAASAAATVNQYAVPLVRPGTSDEVPSGDPAGVHGPSGAVATATR